MSSDIPATTAPPTIRSAPGDSAALHVRATGVAPSIAFTTSIRTPQGRLLVDITWEALSKLHRPAHEATLLATLVRHAPRFNAAAMWLATLHAANRITIDVDQVNWCADDVD